MDDSDKKIDRRKFLTEAGVVVGGLGLASCSKLPFSGRYLSSVTDDNQFHFIVIGSGAGGGPLASRLAEFGFRVLVLEAGGDQYGPIEAVPVSHAKASENPATSWKFFVKHYENEKSQKQDSKYVKDKGIFYPRASSLGGSTVMNAMITMYPDNRDWTHIEKLTGDATWSPENMRRYFQRLENNKYKYDNGENAGRHGYKGWLSTEQNNLGILLKDEKFPQVLLGAVKEEGIYNEVVEAVERGDFQFSFDPNDYRYVQKKTEGILNVPKSTLNGRRHGPRERLLEVQKRLPKNLIIKTNSFVTELIFDERDSKKVIGVNVQEGSHLYSADPLFEKKHWGNKKSYFCLNEVILSGGTFNSPQILMLSGIGDREALNSLGINCRAHLPGVGRNMHDRYEVGVVSELKDKFKSLANCNLNLHDDPCLDDYLKNQKRHLYGTNGVLIGLNKKSSPFLENPDLFVFGIPGYFKGYYPGYSADTLKTKNMFSWIILKAQTRNNAGQVKLKSKDPFTSPDISFKYFHEGNQSSYMNDLEAMLQGVKIAKKINNNLFMKGMIKKQVVPDSRLQTAEDLKKFIMNESWGHHASCTNPIGAANDPMAVLDSRFNVRGVKGLRVVDASSFPRIPGMFIALPIYMISEKAADVIRYDYRHQLRG